VTPRQGPEINSPGLDDDNSEGTRRLSVFRLIQAHERYWADDAHVAALRQSCADDHQAVGEHGRKIRPDQVVHVLRVMATTASFVGLVANLTVSQLASKTLLPTEKVKDALRVAIASRLITNVNEALKPIGNRPGRAPRRRLDYLEQAIHAAERIAPAGGTSPRTNSSAEDSNSAARRPGLSTTALHKTREPATFDDPAAASTLPNDWERTFRRSLEQQICTTTHQRPNAVNQQYGSRIRTIVKTAHERYASHDAAAVDTALIRYYADVVVRNAGNPNTANMLDERYPAATA
jgi:phage baseplate assembly protein W